MEKKRRIIDKRVKQKFLMDDAYLNGYAKFCGYKATLVYISLCRHASKDQYCFPSERLIAEELAISKKSVMRGIKDLKLWNIIDIQKEKRGSGLWKNNSYILLDKSVWRLKPAQKTSEGINNQETVSPPPEDCEGADQETVRDTKETHIEGNTIKEGNASVAGVSDVMNIFYRINPTLNWKNKTTRLACEELIGKFGLEQTITMAEQVIAIQGEPYAPVATNPYQMKEKLAQFKIYFDKRNKEVHGNKPQFTKIS